MVTHSPSLPKGSSVTPFVRSSLHSKSSLHSQSFTFGSFLLAVSSLIINSIQSVFTPQVHSFTQSFPLVWNFTQLIQELRVPSLRSVLQFTRSYKYSLLHNVQVYKHLHSVLQVYYTHLQSIPFGFIKPHSRSRPRSFTHS